MNCELPSCGTNGHTCEFRFSNGALRPTFCAVCAKIQATFFHHPSRQLLLAEHADDRGHRELCPGSFEVPVMQPHKWGTCSPEPGIPLCTTCKHRHELVVNRVKAAWRLKRVQTDPVMSILIDALTTGAVVPAAEIADASEGRIVIENAQQQSDLIAVAWGTRKGDRWSGAYIESARQYIASSRVSAWRWVPGSYNVFEAGIGIDETEVPRELELTIEPMTVEFDGEIERVMVYNAKGKCEIQLKLNADRHVRRGMTFRAIVSEEGDFVRLRGRTSYHGPRLTGDIVRLSGRTSYHGPRLTGDIVRRESAINQRLGNMRCGLCEGTGRIECGNIVDGAEWRPCDGCAGRGYR